MNSGVTASTVSHNAFTDSSLGSGRRRTRRGAVGYPIRSPTISSAYA